MQARVYRLRERGLWLDRLVVRQRPPATGELELRLRLLGRTPARNIYLAVLSQEDKYVIPPLDDARVVAISGRWLHLEGEEVTALRGKESHRPQEWWCRIVPFA